jgi:cytochrome P450
MQQVNTDTKTVPGPRGNPVVGSMFEFQRDRLGFILKLALRYGDVVKYRLANLSLYQVNHPEGVQRILQENNHNYIKGTSFDLIRYFAGNGLFTSEGEFWLRQRRQMQPVFHRQRLAGFGELMTRLTLEMLERWQPKAAEGHPLDIFQEMTHLTMQIVTGALFSSSVPGPLPEIEKAITTVLADIAYRFDVPFYPPYPVPTPRNRRTLAAQGVIDKAIYAIIEERRRHPVESNDLLALLMEARDEETGEGMSDKQLHDEVLTLFIAGHETTANALSWAWYQLSMHPEVERRLRHELDSVLNGRLPTPDDLPRMPYARMVIDETLRLHPPAWITDRTAVNDDVIRGYPIPAGATVSVSPYVVHRLPDYWENPEAFDPERFSPERSAGRAPFAYFPFGGGPHQCIGKGFSLMEAQLILATVVQHYRLELVPGHPVEGLAQTTLRPRYGICMTLRNVLRNDLGTLVL